MLKTVFAAFAGGLMGIGVLTAAAADEVLGVDVSHYQGDIDWDEVKAAGMVFAVAKAAQGDTSGDNDFDENWPAMKAVGLLRGAYDFYVVADEPKTQAEDFIKRLTLEPGDLPPVVDVETKGSSRKSQSQMVSELHSYLEILSAHYGVDPIIYTGPGFWNANFDDSFSGYALWVAEYGVSQPKPVTGWSTWTFWQYSQDGSEQGISGPVDLDRFNGSEAQLRKFLVPAK